MSAAPELTSLDDAVAANELTEEETAQLREYVDSGLTIEEGVALIADRREPAAPEAPAKPEPQREPTEADLRRFERENERHERELRKIMGSALDEFEACEHCGGVGFAPPGPAQPEPLPHDYFHGCETCNGYGLVLTGSLRQGNETRDCPSCKGRGYVEALTETGAPLAEQPPQQPLTIAPPPPAPIEVAGQPAPPEPAPIRFGTPAWMGDPGIGQ